MQYDTRDIEQYSKFPAMLFAPIIGLVAGAGPFQIWYCYGYVCLE